MFSACCSLAVWVSHVVHCSEPLWHSLLWYWQERLTMGLALQFPRQMFVLTISYSSRRHSTGVAHLHPTGWHDLPEVGGARRAQWPYYPIWGEPRETPCWITLFCHCKIFKEKPLVITRAECLGWDLKSILDLGNSCWQNNLTTKSSE